MKGTKNLPLFRSLIGVTLLGAGAFVLCTAISSGTQGPVSFGTLFIVTTTDDHNDFVCDDDCTLREAIQAANNTVGGTDAISFAVTGTINLAAPLPPITDSVSINGPGADKLTINGGHAYRIFNVATAGTVNFSGMTIANGFAPGSDGGGIQSFNGATVNVTKCNLSSNFATN